MSGSSEDEGFLLIGKESNTAPSTAASGLSTKVSAHGFVKQTLRKPIYRVCAT